MFDLCKYKNIFGKPKTGAHSLRIFDIAIIDVVLTILLAYILSIFTKYKFITLLIILFLSGILLHRMFCVRTTIDKLLFSNT
jgi:fatty acid desaturase